MKDPVFSFIVPVYNAQPYLEECLTSIARQLKSDAPWRLMEVVRPISGTATVRNCLQP